MHLPVQHIKDKQIKYKIKKHKHKASYFIDAVEALYDIQHFCIFF